MCEKIEKSTKHYIKETLAACVRNKARKGSVFLKEKLASPATVPIRILALREDSLKSDGCSS